MLFNSYTVDGSTPFPHSRPLVLGLQRAYSIYSLRANRKANRRYKAINNIIKAESWIKGYSPLNEDKGADNKTSTHRKTNEELR